MLNLTRLPDWDRRLARAVDTHAVTPGEWGVSDCLLTVADIIQAITGVDTAEDIRGKYRTSIGATRALRSKGYANVEEALAARFSVIGTLCAQRGDVGVVEVDGALAAGFVCDRGFAVKGERGLTFMPQTAIKTAFKVG